MIYSPQCLHCKNRIPGWPDRTKNTPNCLAYPDEISEELYTNKVMHTKPYPGDHGIQFEKKLK